MGDSVTMRCQPTGQGPFQIEWQKVGGILPPGVREFDGVLEIRQVTPADAGQYRCIATNNAGTSEGYATLNVAGERPWCTVESSLRNDGKWDCEPFVCVFKNLKQNEAQSTHAESTHKGVN